MRRKGRHGLRVGIIAAAALLAALPSSAQLLMVSSDPAGARATLDGEVVGDTPVSVDLSGTEIRQTQVLVQKEGYVPVRMAFTLALQPDKLQALHVFLTPGEGGAPAPPAEPTMPPPEEGEPATPPYAPAVDEGPAPPAGDGALRGWLQAFSEALNLYPRNRGQ